MEESKVKYTAAVMGATGDIGSKLVDLLVKDERWESVLAVVRNAKEEWKEETYKKVKCLKLDDFGMLSAKASSFAGINLFFSALGVSVSKGKKLFYTVEHDYTLEFAEMAIDAKAHAFYYVSSVGAKASSWTYYTKVKGQTEEDLKNMDLRNLGIWRPGLLLERDNATGTEKFLSWVPFVDKVRAQDVAKAMLEHSVTSYANNDLKEFTLLRNADIVEEAKKCTIE